MKAATKRAKRAKRRARVKVEMRMIRRTTAVLQETSRPAPAGKTMEQAMARRVGKQMAQTLEELRLRVLLGAKVTQ